MYLVAVKTAQCKRSMACKLAQSAGPRLRVPDKTTAIDDAQPAAMSDQAFTTLSGSSSAQKQ
eukprot:1996325-Amphidinium_carterae.1